MSSDSFIYTLARNVCSVFFMHQNNSISRGVSIFTITKKEKENATTKQRGYDVGV